MSNFPRRPPFNNNFKNKNDKPMQYDENFREKVIRWATTHTEPQQTYGIYQNFAIEKKNENKIKKDEFKDKTMFQNIFFKTIYEKQLQYKHMIFLAYIRLYERINYKYPDYINNIIQVIITGNLAYIYYLIEEDKEIEIDDYSCLNIKILIDHKQLSEEQFTDIFEEVSIIASQVLSKYKNNLDYIATYLRESNTRILEPEYFQSFVINYNKNLKEVSFNKKYIERKYVSKTYQSPYQNSTGVPNDPQNKNDELRKQCSALSELILNHNTVNNSIVTIPVPHYDKCETIFLHKTPLTITFNKTLDYKKYNNEKWIANYNLLTLNLIHRIVKSTNNENEFLTLNVPLINIIIPNINDEELYHNIIANNYIEIFDEYIDQPVIIPDLRACIDELFRNIYVYNDDESLYNKEKNTKMLNKLIEIYKSKNPTEDLFDELKQIYSGQDYDISIPSTSTS